MLTFCNKSQSNRFGKCCDCHCGPGAVEVGEPIDAEKSYLAKVEAERDKYRAALERLASAEAIECACTLSGMQGIEARARMDYARRVLDGE